METKVLGTFVLYYAFQKSVFLVGEITSPSSCLSCELEYRIWFSQCDIVCSISNMSSAGSEYSIHVSLSVSRDHAVVNILHTIFYPPPTC